MTVLSRVTSTSLKSFPRNPEELVVYSIPPAQPWELLFSPYRLSELSSRTPPLSATGSRRRTVSSQRANTIEIAVPTSAVRIHTSLFGSLAESPISTRLDSCLLSASYPISVRYHRHFQNGRLSPDTSELMATVSLIIA